MSETVVSGHSPAQTVRVIFWFGAAMLDPDYWMNHNRKHFSQNYCAPTNKCMVPHSDFFIKPNFDVGSEKGKPKEKVFKTKGKQSTR